MAWYDSEAEFFAAMDNGELSLHEVSGYHTQRDQQLNANVGTFFGMSREYSVRTSTFGSTGYVLHTHQVGSFISAAHIKDGSFGRITFRFNDLRTLDNRL
ncbi:hypothetical protein [Pyxidicoccus trucidator]|jgi:hypothetical protein|uniref:hypothetical protein n=1 Tax=Pyxidicoccus trucidator TaxID=2709662 RepID=UPI0013D91913|nr:hypothetical protein [Pyxidicoccus trucidator]